MPGRGFAPGARKKDPTQVRRRNKPVPVPVLEADGKTYGPELPSSFQWPGETLKWWETWRTSAQASKFAETDWSFLIDTAVLHAQFWNGNWAVAAELRLRVAKFGATLEDRARLKFAIGEPDTPADVPVTRLRTRSEGARRGRLLQAVSANER